MPFYRSVGEIPAKRHTLAGPADQPHAEELMGLNGFSSSRPCSTTAAHRARSSPSSRPTTREPVARSAPARSSARSTPPPHRRRSGGHRPRHRTPRCSSPTSDVTVAVARAGSTSPLYRTALGDELTFVQSGRGRLETTFGSLDVAAGDYVVVPTATTHRWVIADGVVETLVIEARGGHIAPPRKYLGAVRPVPRRRAVLRARPARPDRAAARRRRRRRGPRAFARAGSAATSTATIRSTWSAGTARCGPTHCRSTTSNRSSGCIHQPPPVHQTFEGPGFVICSFVPRLLRFPPAGGEGAVPPRQRRQRRGAVLLGRRTS